MRKYMLPIIACIPIFMKAQRNYTQDEIDRLAELGKIWGIVHNFHPSMAWGIISTDSLVSDIAASLASDPSAANFRTCLEKMLTRLKDPLTEVEVNKDTLEKLSVPSEVLPYRRLLADSVLYVFFPSEITSEDVIKKTESLQARELARYRGLIFDFRNAKNPGDDYFLTQTIIDSILRKMINKPFQKPLRLFRYQAGFLDQRAKAPETNVYSAGWQTSTPDMIQPAENRVEWNVKMVAVINRFSSPKLVDYLVALRSGGYCRIVFDGDSGDYLTDAALDFYTIPDSIHLKIRVKDYIDNSGTIFREPDLITKSVVDEADFLEKCRMLALSGKQKDPVSEQTTPFFYSHPFPTDTNVAFAPVGRRLFGLYNYWNAINYFYPNKHLLKQSWDSTLNEFIPRFIKADDTTLYYLTIRDLVSRIHDSHGFFGRLPVMKKVTETYNYNVPLTLQRIEKKYFVIAVSRDSTQNMNQFRLWDEIIAIDSIPVNKYKEKFRSYFSASNDWTFERDLCWYLLLSGPMNTVVRITVLRDGKTLHLDAIRSTLNYRFDTKLVSFNDDHKDVEILGGNIGYVNMGSLQTERVDKMFDTLKGTKAIIFDIRNYPRGTAWSIAPRLTDHDSAAVKFGTPYITYGSVVTSTLISNKSDYFIVNADKTKPFYKGKIILLCNAETQSQAEYTIMMLQGAGGKRVTVIGSPTAGADGNVTAITLPGGYSTYFSGLEVLYPDGSQTQQTGIRIDLKSQPTLKGLKAGKDEVLERAVQFIQSGK